MRDKNKLLLISIIAIAIVMYFVANFQRIAVPGAIFDLLEQELSVSAPFITAFGAIYMYVYAICQLINGVLVDRYGGTRVMFMGAIVLSIGCILFPCSSSLLLMYIARGFIGFGASTFYLSLIKELKNLFSERNYGIAISVMLFIGYTGAIAANAPFVAMMKYLSWRDILLGIACVVSVLTVLFALILPHSKLPKVNNHVKLRLLPFRLVLHKRHNRNLFSFACCNFGITYVIQTVIGKKFLEDFCTLSVSKAAMVLSTMAVVAAIFNIVNASVCKLCHNKRVRFLKGASVITFVCLLLICTFIYLNIKSPILMAVVFCILAGNASLTSLLVPVLFLTNRKMISTTAVSIMNFCFFMMVGILGTITGFLLNVFKPERINGVLVYGQHSYLLLFGTFLLLSMFEMYKAAKLSNKY